MMRKPTVPKVPLSKRTQPLNKPNVTNKISKSKSATKPVTKTKPKAETAKSACELRPESSLSEDIHDEKSVPFQPIEMPVNDDYQPNGDKLKKAGDNLMSGTPYPSLTQEHVMDIRMKLIEDLETERLARKQLESDSQRLQSQIHTLQQRMDERQAAVNKSPRPATRPMNAQQQSKLFGSRKTQASNSVVKKTESPAYVDDTPIEESDKPGETVESLRAELGDKMSKIADLENGSRQLDTRCLALESEITDLKSMLDHAHVRAETLERENADLKLELDNEMQLHSTEIAKLSDRAYISSEKFEKLENENAELVRELAESAKARSEEAETCARKLREAITTENEIMNARTGQHDLITQHLKDIQRKENFISTLKSENECLCRKNKALELKIELLEREEKTVGAYQSRGQFAGDEHASCRKQFERLKVEVEDTKESFRNLWTIHDRETLALKRANREKEDEYRHYVNEQSKRFSEEMEKMRKMIDKKANIPQNERESTKQIGYNRDKNNKYNSHSIDGVYSEEDDDEKCVAVSYIGD